MAGRAHRRQQEEDDDVDEAGCGKIRQKCGKHLRPPQSGMRVEKR
jgi:hypothetical protein